jgi:hypothetical protein
MQSVAHLSVEVSEELRLWPPAPPRNVLFIGREGVFAAVRDQFNFAKLASVCEPDVSTKSSSTFWKEAEWGRNQEVLFCVDLFGNNASSRSCEFFRKAHNCLRREGRIIAIERVEEGDPEYLELIRAAMEAGSKLSSALPLEADKKWLCYVFQWGLSQASDGAAGSTYSLN